MIRTVFESLQKAFAKAKTVVEKEGATPRFYIRSLVELEDFVKTVTFSVNGTMYLRVHVCDVWWKKLDTLILAALGGQRGQGQTEQDQCQSELKLLKLSFYASF